MTKVHIGAIAIAPFFPLVGCSVAPPTPEAVPVVVVVMGAFPAIVGPVDVVEEGVVATPALVPAMPAIALPLAPVTPPTVTTPALVPAMPAVVVPLAPVAPRTVVGLLASEHESPGCISFQLLVVSQVVDEKLDEVGS